MISIPNFLVNTLIIFKIKTNLIIFIGELLLDYVLSHFEDACENLTLIKQVILQCCTCLISLGVLRIEDIANNNLFQV